MTRIWDQGQDCTNDLYLNFVGGRKIEAVNHGGWKYILVWIGADMEIKYSYGDTNSWTTTTLTGSGSPPIPYNTADIQEVAIGIDHNNGHVHIAWIADSKVYHSQLEDPDDPGTTGDWRTYGANKYQRVDNSSYAKTHVSIAVDDGVQGANGSNRPHVVWDEYNTVSSKYEVRYNVGDGANEAFTNTDEIAILTDDYRYPTIININEEGRQLYMACCKNSSYVVNVLRCLSADNPQTASNWKGPQTGTTTPDMMFGVIFGESYSSPPSMTWWWDIGTHETVFVTASTFGASTGRVQTNVYQDSNTSWMGQHEAYGLWSTMPTVSTCTMTYTNKFRLFVRDSSPYIWFATEGATANDFVFTTSSDWQKAYGTAGKSGVPVSVEYRSREHNDNKTHGIDKTDVDDIYFYQFRYNHTPVNTQVSPVDGACLAQRTGKNITLDWDFTDADSDTQAYYAVQVSTGDFGSCIVDTGWTASATSSYTITGGTLAANTLYFWRVRTRDSEAGDYRDPYSEESWSSDLRYFTTTPQLVLNLDPGVQQSDKDCYIDIYFSSNLDVPADCPNADLDDGSTVYFQYSTNGGGAWSNGTVISGECTSTPAGPIATSPWPGSKWTLAWNSDTDLGSSFDGDVLVRARGRYDGDSEGLGYCGYYQSPSFHLDFGAPVVTLGWPNGCDVADRTPLIHISVTDDSGFLSQIQVDKNGDFSPSDYDSGYVDSALTYQITTQLSVGTWYFRAKAKDKSASANESSWTASGQFEVLDGCYSATILDDNTNTVVLNVIETTEVILDNLLIEYDSIVNDFEHDTMNRNPIEYRGHRPIEVSLSVLLYGSTQDTDIRRLHTWETDNTKLILKDSSGKSINLGSSTILEYIPEGWRIVYLSEGLPAGQPNVINYNIRLREVPAV